MTPFQPTNAKRQHADEVPMRALERRTLCSEIISSKMATNQGRLDSISFRQPNETHRLIQGHNDESHKASRNVALNNAMANAGKSLELTTRESQKSTKRLAERFSMATWRKRDATLASRMEHTIAASHILRCVVRVPVQVEMACCGQPFE